MSSKRFGVAGAAAGNVIERFATREEANEILVQLKGGERRAIVQAKGSDAEAESTGGTFGVVLELPLAAKKVGSIRGGGPGTHETDALDPSTLVPTVDAVVVVSTTITCVTPGLSSPTLNATC